MYKHFTIFRLHYNAQDINLHVVVYVNRGTEFTVARRRFKNHVLSGSPSDIDEDTSNTGSVFYEHRFNYHEAANRPAAYPELCSAMLHRKLLFPRLTLIILSVLIWNASQFFRQGHINWSPHTRKVIQFHNQIYIRPYQSERQNYVLELPLPRLLAK